MTQATEYTTVELLTLQGPEHRRVSTAPPRPATLEEIPIIDLHGMKYSEDVKMEIVAYIKSAATASGFFYIQNHGISEDVVANALKEAKLFFSQSEEKKMEVRNRKNRWGNGWAPVRSGQINASESPGLLPLVASCLPLLTPFLFCSVD
jgi:hypothetical protein